MNKEEKEAIENIEHIIEYWQPLEEDELATIEYYSIKKLYEMYKKQQKEIEELKELNKKLTLKDIDNLDKQIEKD